MVRFRWLARKESMESQRNMHVLTTRVSKARVVNTRVFDDRGKRRGEGPQSWAMIGQSTMKPLAPHGPLGKAVILPAAARSAILATSL
jgi:hypothetical protein